MVSTKPRTSGWWSSEVTVVSVVEQVAVGVRDRQVHRTRHAWPALGLRQRLAQPYTVLGLEQVVETRADQVAGLAAEHGHGRGRLVADDEVAVDDGDDVGGVLDERAEPALAGAEVQRALRDPALQVADHLGHLQPAEDRPAEQGEEQDDAEAGLDGGQADGRRAAAA